MKRLTISTIISTLSLFFAGAANANILQDGTFLDPIGTGSNLTPWSDWTNAGITRHAAPTPIPGNYARLPNSPNGGSDLFQRFSPLANGEYTLSFFVQNQSPWSAELVFAVQQAFGTPVSVVFAMGTGAVLDLPASSSFLLETLTFTIANPSFIPNELTFSNSYDYPQPVIANSVNPPGTIINIADVSLTPVGVPGPIAGAGLPGLIFAGGSLLVWWRNRRARKGSAAVVAA
jgi:hypothetical protein